MYVVIFSPVVRRWANPGGCSPRVSGGWPALPAEARSLGRLLMWLQSGEREESLVTKEWLQLNAATDRYGWIL